MKPQFSRLPNGECLFAPRLLGKLAAQIRKTRIALESYTVQTVPITHTCIANVAFVMATCGIHAESNTCKRLRCRIMNQLARVISPGL